MAYPRILKLDDDIKVELCSYLNGELTNHKAEHDIFIDDLISMQRDYWAKARGGKRTFPFTGAADLVIPLSAIAFEAIHARVMTTLFGLKQRVSCKAKSPEFTDIAPKMESFYADELERMKFRPKLEPAIMEIGKFGSGVGRAGYCREVKYGVRDVGGEEVEFPVIIKQGAEINAVPLSRFLMPFGENDPQLARWCGEEHSWSENQILIAEQGGLFEEGTHERLKSYYIQAGNSLTNSGDKFERSQQEAENRVPNWPSRLSFVEVWLSWNVDGDENGRRREIVAHYHQESNSLMSIRNNWHSDLRRPYRTGVYFPIEHRWTGIGICKQNESFQKEITTQHRQRLDNATLANMRMLVVSRMSGYGPGEPVFPGKMWFVDDMTHVQALQMTDVYPSAYGDENQSLLYSQQRTGVNDSTLGMPQVGTPGTATADLQRVQEGKKKFDYTFGNIKLFVNELLVDAACEIQQWGPRDLKFFDYADGGQLIQQVLQLPEQLIRDGLVLEIKLAGEQENKLVDRQNWQAMAAMLTQYYTQMLQIAQMMGNGQMVAMIAQRAMVAATEAMKQISESYDVKNIDRIVILDFIENVKAITANAGPNNVGPGIAGGGNAGAGVGGNGIIQTPAAPLSITGTPSYSGTSQL
jgi:hypothetical protein